MFCTNYQDDPMGFLSMGPSRISSNRNLWDPQWDPIPKGPTPMGPIPMWPTWNWGQIPLGAIEWGLWGTPWDLWGNPMGFMGEPRGVYGGTPWGIPWGLRRNPMGFKGETPWGYMGNPMGIYGGHPHGEPHGGQFTMQSHGKFPMGICMGYFCKGWWNML